MGGLVWSGPSPARLYAGEATVDDGAAHGRNVRIDPGLDVVHHNLLVDVVQEVVEVPVVELQRLVARAGRLVEPLAAARLRRPVGRAVEDEHRQRDQRKDRKSTRLN